MHLPMIPRAGCCRVAVPRVGECRDDVIVGLVLVVDEQWYHGVGVDGSCPDGCDQDLNADGIVDVSDLLIVVGNWGECE